MLWRTHLMTGITAGYLIAGPDPTVLLTAGVAALLPDIDHPNSYIGRKIPVIPKLIKATLGHRGALHSASAAVLVFLAATLIGGPLLGIATGTGYLIHIMGDMLTPSGVPLLWPVLGKNVKLAAVKTGGLMEKFVVFPGICLGLVMLTINSLFG